MGRLRTIICISVLALGCSETGDYTRAANYSNNAKDNYDKGLAELKSENWPDAIKYFSYTRSKFGFSKWATLAELGIADAEFGREKYPEAIEAYRNFIKAHPTHEKVQDGYAAFRIGNSFYKEIPSDWFMVPPAYEKDQGPVHDAVRELTAFVDEYNDSKYLPKAKEMVSDCMRRLADHEIYVANFYLDRNKPLASIGRLEYLIKQYPGSNREPEVLLLLGRTYLKLDKPVEARRTFERLVETHPGDFHAAKAKLYLDYIAKRYGAGHG